MGAEVTTVSSTGAKKGVKKQRFELIPPRAVMELTKLYGRGAKKYAPNNFRLGYETSKSFGAGQRHAILFWSGENLDAETECHHIASFAWHCFTILESNLTHPEFDDRPYGASHLGAGRVHTTETPQLSVAPAPQTLPTDYRHDLIPLYPFAQVAEVFGTRPDLAIFDADITFGRFYGLMQDHANRYWAGEDTDDDSGLPNLAWSAAYALLLIELSTGRPEADDRFLPAAPLGYDSVPTTAAPVEPKRKRATRKVADEKVVAELVSEPVADVPSVEEPAAEVEAVIEPAVVEPEVEAAIESEPEAAPVAVEAEPVVEVAAAEVEPEPIVETVAEPEPVAPAENTASFDDFDDFGAAPEQTFDEEPSMVFDVPETALAPEPIVEPVIVAEPVAFVPAAESLTDWVPSDDDEF